MAKYWITKTLLTIILICNAYQLAYPVSIVYNMRIRRTFAGSGDLFGKKDKPIWSGTILPIFYTRDRHIVDQSLALDLYEKRFYAGPVFNLRYMGKKRKWWAEATTAIAKESATFKGSQNLKVAHGGVDDLVLASGWNFFPTDETQITVYGLAGFPTKTSVSAQDAQDTLVGTRFFSVGAGSEFSYGFMKEEKQSAAIIFQNRFIHFFDRRFFPLLPCNSKIEPGNVIDLLFALRYRSKLNMLETGYDMTIFANQAVKTPTQKIKSNNFIRHSGYINFTHLCKHTKFFDKPLSVGAGLSVSRANEFDTNIFICWFNATVIF